jgi:hypothetical protein
VRGSVRKFRGGAARFLSTLLAAGLLGLVLSASAQAAAGSIAGNVVEPGAAIASNYEVDLFDATLTKVDSVCTTGGGTYGFDGLATGQYYVYFSGGAGGSFHAAGCTADTFASGWWPGNAFQAMPSPTTFNLAEPVSVTDGAATSGIDVQLAVGRTISGTASDSVSASGIPNIDVKILDIPNGNLVGSTCTAPNGTYSVGKLPSTLYDVEFKDDGTCPAIPLNHYKIQYYNGGASINEADQVDLSSSDKSGIDASLLQGINHVLVVTTNGSGSGSVASSDGGRIHCPSGACQNVFNDGTVVTLTATPNPGSVFAGWIGGVCSGTSPCDVTMDADKSVEAIFAPATPPTKHTLTVATAGSGAGTVTASAGGISCPGACSAQLNEGTAVTLTATPASGSTFTGWSGGCSGTGPCQVTLSADAAVTATFTASGTGLRTAKLSVKTAGTGSGHVTASAGGISCPGTCSADITTGSAITLTATASAGSTFAGWSGGGCSGSGTCRVTVDAATTVTATFTVDTGAPPTSKPHCSLAILSAHVASNSSKRKPKSGRLTLRLSCDQTAAVTVIGAITERITKHRTKGFRLKTIHASATGGRENTIIVKLPSAVIKGLTKHRKESALFTLVARNSVGASHATARVNRLKF